MRIKLLIIALLLSNPAIADLNNAVKAYTEDNYATALQELQQPVAQGDPKAEYLLGHMYYRGQGVPRDPVKAEQFLLLSARKGFPRAQSYIGFLYFLKGNYKEAFSWLQKAATQGDLEGENLLGYMYEMGKAVPLDFKQAVFWYKKAADHGDSWGQYNLGYMYLNGLGVAKNEATAAILYQKSAQQGFRKAQYGLGELYAEGRGMIRDKIQAYAWMSAALANGYEKARIPREFLAKTLTPEQLQHGENLAKEYIVLYKEKQ